MTLWHMDYRNDLWLAASAYRYQPPAPRAPRLAADTPNMSWNALAAFDFVLSGMLHYEPTDENTPRWTTTVELAGYVADIHLYSEDVLFLNSVLGLALGKTDYPLSQSIEVYARRGDTSAKALVGVGAIWTEAGCIWRVEWWTARL